MTMLGRKTHGLHAGSWIGAALCTLMLATLSLFPNEAHAMKVQEVKSPGGINAWLVEAHGVPLIAMRFAFDGGGSVQDPHGKEGLANFLSSILDEGAGDLTSKQFQERMEDLAMRMSFDDGRDAFYGSFETLTENRDAAVKLLALAVNKPRFDAEAIERMRKQHLAGLAYAARDPTRVASEQWMALFFADHPYGRPANGTPKSVAAIARADLAGFHGRVFAKDALRVVVVGDIDAKALGAMLDEVFGALPAKATLSPVAKAEAKAVEKLKVFDMNVPQSVARFGLPAMPRTDKDFMPAFVLNTILGGSAGNSRLYKEVREKRGLAYGVDTSIIPMRHASMFFGGVATKNEEVGRSLDVIRDELKRIVTEGPTEQELADTKAYLTGSFALRFDTSANIANQLLWMLMEGMGHGYVETRNAQVEAVTLDDVRRVAKRLFENQDLLVTVVGRPKGLGSGG
ncbi:MAG TPA: pitrilysin family protein [Hyphomicrobiaceae bacterium]|jgi:zinc protease|nr:pitrilysin family protein [Hyphomicrobiaceae bacterium]